MTFDSILLGITAASLLNSPAMADIKLTNGDFSSGSTGWSDLTGFTSTLFDTTSTLFDTTGMAANAPADGSPRCIYQKVSPTLETAATVIFDVTVNTLSSGAKVQDFDFRLVKGAAGSLTGAAGSLTNTVALITNNSHQFTLYGGPTSIFTSAFAVTAGTTYTISLYMSGMDGAGGQMGKVSGSILDNTTMVATRFSVSHANIASFDGLAFIRDNSGATHQYTIDNVTVVRE